MPTLLILLFFTLSLGAQTYSSSIPASFYEVQTGGVNQVMNLTSGIHSLQLRLDMIRRSKKNIEVEYFIFNTDLGGKFILRELALAAKRGVKVRLLVDKSLAVFQLDEYYARELKRRGIETRYYNNASVIRISTVQFRNHRKLLSVDDQEAITGGRNIGSDYFDLSPDFNFYDRDIYVKGPLAVTMRKSFDAYFEHEITERPEFPEPPQRNDKKKEFLNRMDKVVELFIETEEDRKLKVEIERIARLVETKTKLHECPEATFASDAPGANFMERLKPKFDERFKFLRKVLYDKITPVDRRVTISSPYLINNDNSRDLMDKMIAKGVAIDVYTNSLASTDAVYVAANLYLELKAFKKAGVNIFLHDGTWLNETPVVNEAIKTARWGTHCKTQVYETSKYSEVMIGTYNIDNRSNFYNSEMAVFCKGNNEFSSEVRESILARAKVGYSINADGTAQDKSGNKKSVFGSTESELLKMRIITLPSWMLKFLL